VGCETDKPTLSDTSAEITSLAQSVAQRLYDGGNGAINAEVTGRTTQIEVNADGTKTIATTLIRYLPLTLRLTSLPFKS
jgi:hypothetical protein